MNYFENGVLGKIHRHVDLFVTMETKIRYKSKILLCASYRLTEQALKFVLACKVVQIKANLCEIFF